MACISAIKYMLFIVFILNTYLSYGFLDRKLQEEEGNSIIEDAIDNVVGMVDSVVDNVVLSSSSSSDNDNNNIDDDDEVNEDNNVGVVDVVVDDNKNNNSIINTSSILPSILSQDRLSELYDAIRNNGDDNIRNYLEETFGNVDNFQEDINALTTSLSSSSDDDAVRDNSSSSITAMREYDCSFENIDRECFIINYGGFVGNTWGTEQFDIDKATFIVNTFLVNDSLLTTVSDIMCLTVDIAMPLFAGETPIGSEEIDAFFTRVNENCSIST